MDAVRSTPPTQIFRLVYSTCLFCHGRLGTNDAIERFAVGRRLAFDAAKGRLWVVCGRCRRWNLTPLEERWEAIEECERAFRATRLRSSTPNIGMARLSSGLVLIRVGKPLRPELAAWRYVDVIRRRRVVALAASGVAFAAIAGIGYGAYALTGVGSIGSILLMARDAWLKDHAIHRVRISPDRWFTVRPRYLSSATWLPPNSDGQIGLELRNFKRKEPVRLTGPDAQRALRPILAHLNRRVGSRTVVNDALHLLDQIGGSPFRERDAARVLWVRHIHRIARRARPSIRAGLMPEAMHAFDTGQAWPLHLKTMSPAERLALEIDSAEADERELLAGELAGLEAAWREAEEVAAIADNLFLPTHVTEWLRAASQSEPRRRT